MIEHVLEDLRTAKHPEIDVCLLRSQVDRPLIEQQEIDLDSDGGELTLNLHPHVDVVRQRAHHGQGDSLSCQLAPASRIDVRRFRPNLVIATEAEGFVEAGWTGRRLRAGGATLDVLGPCPRCVMITHGFGDVPQDTGLMRTVVKEADQNVGAYARVASAGRS